jgi:hypothetical protein
MCYSWKYRYRVYWNQSYPLSILKVIFLKLSFWSVTNKNADIGKVTQSVTVKREMLTEATFNQTNFWFIHCTFLWHKILALIFNMFIYSKVGHSKFVGTKCTGTLYIFNDLHPSLIGILFLKVRSIYNCLHADTSEC